MYLLLISHRESAARALAAVIVVAVVVVVDVLLLDRLLHLDLDARLGDRRRCRVRGGGGGWAVLALLLSFDRPFLRLLSGTGTGAAAGG